ncbi:hypothetical protein ACFXPS_42890 [Nocardia sp. NPDC059091]|uniref:hypothetical protein n=1 Tax=unclassified Nocardia TaxID=2637762 RepID=UPI00367E6F0B
MEERGEYLRGTPTITTGPHFHGLARIVGAADHLIDQHITAARRREHRRRDGTIEPGTPVSWAKIGDALNISGQAAGKRARATGSQ